MFKGIVAALFPLALMVGCSATTVSPAIASKPGVTTGFNGDGYAIVKSIVFQRPAADPSRLLKCVQTEVDGLTAPPVELDGSVKANGRAYAQLQYSNYVSYSLTVRGGKYTFDRLANAGTNGPAFELMGSSYGTPQNAYSALESLADRISGCAAG